MGHTSIGADCTISPFVVLGGAPQDLSYRGEPTRLEIGGGCTIREGVTMNVGTVKGGGLTRVGDRGFFMNNSHVGHDCMVGNDAIFATSATLGGHCEIGDFVYIGGLSAVHQFTRIGPQVMVGGVCGVRDDVIPFGLVNGQYAALEGLNVIGMRRRKFTRERLATVRVFLSETVPRPGHLRRAACARRSRSPATIPRSRRSWPSSPSGKHRPLAFRRQRQVMTRRPRHDDRRPRKSHRPVGLIAAGGAMPFAVADSLVARGITPVLFALRGACDPKQVAALPPSLDLDRPARPRKRLLRAEGCRDLVFIGALVRPGAVRDPARLGNAARAAGMSGAPFAAATIISSPASAAFSSRTDFAWSASRMSRRIC